MSRSCVRVLPVKAFDSSNGVSASVAAILLIFDYERPVAIDRSVVAKTFGLTPREAEFATLLAHGQDLTQAALEMRIKPSTAREYLKDIHWKTQTHPQSELVSMLLRGSLDILRE